MTATSDQSRDRRRSRWLTRCGVALVLALVGFAAWRVTSMVWTITRFNALLQANAQEYDLLLSNGLPVGNQFLENVRQGRLDAAYDATTATFRARVGRTDFDKFVADNPVLAKPLSDAEWTNRSSFYARVEYGLWQDTVACDRAKMVHTYRAGPNPGGGTRAAVELVLVVEDSSVKVEQCTVAGGDGGKP